MKNQKITIDLRIVCLILVALLAVSIFLWKPWQTSETRTIQVSGQATVQAEPDEFVFSPAYELKGTDRAAIQEQLVAKVNDVIVNLKQLGVEESKITLASTTYDNFWNDGTNEITSNSLTIRVSDKELSQKVQDYLLTTTPSGQISPMPSFSKDKREQLKDEARTKAIEDARRRAEQTASELGAKVGKVQSIEDGSQDLVMPFMGVADVAVSAEAGTARSLPILPGEQEVSYSINVTYILK